MEVRENLKKIDFFFNIGNMCFPNAVYVSNAAVRMNLRHRTLSLVMVGANGSMDNI